MAKRIHAKRELINNINNVINQPFKDTKALREEIIHTCLYLCEIKHFIGTWGNIAVRVEKGFLITPSRIDYQKMLPDDLVVVSEEGEKIKGHRLPTSEMEIHRLILNKRKNFNVSIHTHSQWAATVSCTQRTIPICVEDMAQIIGGAVNCSKYIRGGNHKALAQAALEAMGEDSNAVLLSNHGPVIVGSNLKEAVVAAEVLEKASAIFIHAESIGKCTVIDEQYVKKERYRFLYKYGTESDNEKNEK